jgi:gamma-butyrobetaine dioxygenase
MRNDEVSINETGSNPVIENVHHGIDKRYLKVAWNDGTFSRYPYIFLRDNCKCPQCYERTSYQSFLQTIVDVGLNLEAERASFSDDGQHLKCVWPDGHESDYHLEWLRNNRIPEKEELETRLNTDSLVKDDLILWDAEMLQDKIPLYDYKAVMNDDKSLFEYLNALYQYGLVLLDDGPARDDFLFELGARMGWTQRSYLG